ncbi:hypothetical protein [Halpernia sp. GG3]
MKKKKLKIGLFGYGVVGSGLYEVLQQAKNLKAKIKKNCGQTSGKATKHFSG